jgi:hypothetical protein
VPYIYNLGYETVNTVRLPFLRILFAQQFTIKQYQRFCYFCPPLTAIILLGQEANKLGQSETISAPLVDTVTTRASFVGILEKHFMRYTIIMLR